MAGRLAWSDCWCDDCGESASAVTLQMRNEPSCVAAARSGRVPGACANLSAVMALGSAGRKACVARLCRVSTQH
jgi:hypothetical protein